MKRLKIIALISAVLLISSCIKEGYDYEKCPGDTNIKFNWNNTPTGIGQKNVDIIIINGKDTIHINGNHPESDVAIGLEEGKYEIVANEPADNIRMEGSNVCVGLLPDGSASEPGAFNGGVNTLEVNNQPGSGFNIDIPVRPQTRPLVINVHVNGGGSSSIAQMEGRINGIALSRYINYGFTPINGNPRNPAKSRGAIRYAFQKNSAGIYSDGKTLLGIDGDANQEIDLTLTASNGDIQNIHFNVTREMDGFHVTDIDEPWVIDIEINLSVDFIVTIVDWIAGPESWMEAH